MSLENKSKNEKLYFYLDYIYKLLLINWVWNQKLELTLRVNIAHNVHCTDSQVERGIYIQIYILIRGTDQVFHRFQ